MLLRIGHQRRDRRREHRDLVANDNVVEERRPVQDEDRHPAGADERLYPAEQNRGHHVERLALGQYVAQANGGGHEKDRQVVDLPKVLGVEHPDLRHDSQQADAEADHRGRNVMQEIGHP